MIDKRKNKINNLADNYRLDLMTNKRLEVNTLHGEISLIHESIKHIKHEIQFLQDLDSQFVEKYGK